jgi:hypothetical protein
MGTLLLLCRQKKDTKAKIVEYDYDAYVGFSAGNAVDWQTWIYIASEKYALGFRTELETYLRCEV